MNCKVRAPQVAASARHAALADLYAWTVRDLANEQLFTAQRAGYAYRLRALDDGFSLRVYGWDSQLQDFLGDLCKHIRLDQTFTDVTHFQHIKNRLMRSYRNKVRGWPVRQALDIQRAIMTSSLYSPDQVRAALASITINDLRLFSRTIYRDAALECLVTGNVDQHEAWNLVEAFKNAVELRSVSTDSRRANFQSDRMIELDGSYKFIAKPASPNDPNSAVVSYLQYEGEGHIEDDVFMSFIGKLIRPVAFTQLRTNEGLGYIVWAGNTMRQGVNGIYVAIQSPKKSAYYLNKRVTSFLRTTFRDFLQGFSVEQYKTMFEEARDNKLAERGRWWREIVSQEYNFYRWRREARLLNHLAKNAAAGRGRFLRLYDTLIGYDGISARLNVLVQTEFGQGALSSPTANVPDVTDGAAVLAPPSLNSSEPRKPRGSLATISDQNSVAKRRLVPKDRDDTAYRAPGTEKAASSALGASPEENDGSVEIERGHDESPSFAEVGGSLCPSESELAVECSCGSALCMLGAHEHLATAGLHKMKFRQVPEDTTSFSAPCKPASSIFIRTERFVCLRDGTRYERQTRPCPECPAPVQTDHSCSKSHPRRVYPPRPATAANIAYFRDLVCLFPKKTSNRFFPTLDWWLQQPAARS